MNYSGRRTPLAFSLLGRGVIFLQERGSSAPGAETKRVTCCGSHLDGGEWHVSKRSTLPLPEPLTSWTPTREDRLLAATKIEWQSFRGIHTECG